MKFLVILTIASVCVLNSEAFFFKHGKHGGASSGAVAGGEANFDVPAPIEEPPAPAPQPQYLPPQPQPQPQQPSGHGHGGFDISSLLALPIQLKMKLINAKKQKIEKLMGSFSGLTSKFSGGLGGLHGGHGGSSSSSSSSANAGAAVETYQAQPAPNQAYQQQPVVLHLYQTENNNAQSHAHSVAASYTAQAPQAQYGPPAAPVAQQQVASVDTSYLPPAHGNCQDNAHYH